MVLQNPLISHLGGRQEAGHEILLGFRPKDVACYETQSQEVHRVGKDAGCREGLSRDSYLCRPWDYIRGHPAYEEEQSNSYHQVGCGLAVKCFRWHRQVVWCIRICSVR